MSNLMQLAAQLIRVIVPMIIITGIVGNSLNIIVLSRPTLYNHACSRYFLALASNNLFYTSIILIYRLLADGYQIDPANFSLIFCKISQYLRTISAFLCPYLIILASIDRYCASSTSAQKRNFSSVRVSRRAILFIITLFSLFFINILVMVDLRPGDGLGCNFRIDSVYSQVYIIVQVLLFAIIAPCLMILFGIMTIRNASRNRVIPIIVSRYYRTERQLARMLLLRVSIHIILILPTSVTYLMGILPNKIRTTSEFFFVNTVSQILFDASFATAFALYLLSGGVYRREFIRLIRTKFRICLPRQVQPVTNQNIVQPMTLLIHPSTTNARF